MNGPVKRKRSIEGVPGDDMLAEEDESESGEEDYTEDIEYGQRGDEPMRNVSYARSCPQSLYGPLSSYKFVIATATT